MSSAMCGIFGHGFVSDVDWRGAVTRRYCIRCGKTIHQASPTMEEMESNCQETYHFERGLTSCTQPEGHRGPHTGFFAWGPGGDTP